MISVYTITVQQFVTLAMPKPNHSFDTYRWWESIPVVLLASVGMLIPIIWQFLQLAPSWNEKATKLLHKAARAVFGPPLGVFSNERNSNRDIVYLKGKVVPKPVLSLLGHYVTISVVLILMVFWEIFLIQESFACDDTTIDCFVSNASDENSTVLPVTDCTLYEDIDKDVNIICYKFVYHFGTAMAAAGGMITAIKVITKVVSLIFLKIYSFKSNSLGNCLVVIHLIINFLLVCICFFGLIIGLPIIALLYPTLLPSDLIRAVWILYTLVVLSWIPWRYFVLNDKDQDEDIDQNNKINGTFVLQNQFTWSRFSLLIILPKYGWGFLACH